MSADLEAIDIKPPKRESTRRAHFAHDELALTIRRGRAQVLRGSDVLGTTTLVSGAEVGRADHDRRAGVVYVE